MADTLTRLKKIIADHLDIDSTRVVPEASFSDDLGADSLDAVELIMAFEEYFEIEISDEEAETILTVKNAVDFINEKIAQKDEL